MSSETSPFPLKVLVVSVATIIVGSILMLLKPMLEKEVGACGGGELDFVGRGMVTGLHLEGRDVRVILRTPDGNTLLVTIDPCTGKERGALVVKGDIPPVPAQGQPQQ